MEDDLPDQMFGDPTLIFHLSPKPNFSVDVFPIAASKTLRSRRQQLSNHSEETC